MEIDLIWHMLQISLTTSVVIGLLLLLKPLLRKRYSSKWWYYVWLIIAIRLLIPFSITPLTHARINIPVPETLMQVNSLLFTPQDTEPTRAVLPEDKIESSALLNEKSATVLFSEENRSLYRQQERTQESEESAAFSFRELAIGVWLSGMMIFFIIQALVYIRFLQKLHYSPRYETSPKVSYIFWESGKNLRITMLPEIIVCGAAPSPILTGLFQPVLILPHSKYSERELAFILRHELIHYRRHDLWYKLALILAKAIHWFNPLVWLMAAQASRDIEISCDDMVMSGLNDNDRAFYGETILNTLPIKSKWRTEPMFTTSFGSAKADIIHRLKNLFDMSIKKKGTAAFCVVLLLIGVIGTMVAFTPVIAAGNDNHNVLQSKTAFTDNDDGDSRVVLGPYSLKKQESCTITIIWKESGTQTLQFIKETPDGKESTARTEYTVTSRVPLTVSAWDDGVYRFVIPAGKSMTDIVCIVDYADPRDSDVNNAKQGTSENKPTVVYEKVEMLRYKGGNKHPYVHSIKANNTNKAIIGGQRGMLAYDQYGQPLKIDWFSVDSSIDLSYYYLCDWDTMEISPGQTYDMYGGWSLNYYGKDPSVEEIAYILYCDKEITFEDKTVWINPGYETWRETYEGKQVDIEILKGYYPYAMDIGTVGISLSRTSQSYSIPDSAFGINLSVENCNVVVRHSEDDEFHYEYDTSAYRVIQAETGGMTDIRVERISNSVPSYTPDNTMYNMIAIYIPLRSYDNITVMGKNAGVGLPRLDANLHLTNINGAMSACVPEGFDKTIDYTGFKGSGSINISPKSENYMLRVDAQNSAVSVPPEIPRFTPNRVWEYQNGTSGAKVNIELKDCAFSVKLDKFADEWMRGNI